MILGPAPAHALAAELYLKRVLVELGASWPALAMYLIDMTFADDGIFAKWVDKARSTLLLRGDRGRRATCPQMVA